VAVVRKSSRFQTRSRYFFRLGDDGNVKMVDLDLKLSLLDADKRLYDDSKD